jgi:hypothetical protein
MQHAHRRVAASKHEACLFRKVRQTDRQTGAITTPEREEQDPGNGVGHVFVHGLNARAIGGKHVEGLEVWLARVQHKTRYVALAFGV